ncbi:putative methyltransferase [Pseudomonas aeruginosa]|nr:putative methyltransferase [Pseudomonas aeruginosa]
MRDLSTFADASFDLVFNPISNLYVDDVLPVWRECARVLRPGGKLLASFYNPALFIEDRSPELAEQGPDPAATSPALLRPGKPLRRSPRGEARERRSPGVRP